MPQLEASPAPGAPPRRQGRAIRCHRPPGPPLAPGSGRRSGRWPFLASPAGSHTTLARRSRCAPPACSHRQSPSWRPSGRRQLAGASCSPAVNTDHTSSETVADLSRWRREADNAPAGRIPPATMQNPWPARLYGSTATRPAGPHRADRQPAGVGWGTARRAAGAPGRRDRPGHCAAGLSARSTPLRHCPLYGTGTSERRLGGALRGLRGRSLSWPLRSVASSVPSSHRTAQRRARPRRLWRCARCSTSATTG